VNSTQCPLPPPRWPCPTWTPELSVRPYITPALGYCSAAPSAPLAPLQTPWPTLLAPCPFLSFSVGLSAGTVPRYRVARWRGDTRVLSQPPGPARDPPFELIYSIPVQQVTRVHANSEVCVLSVGWVVGAGGAGPTPPRPVALARSAADEMTRLYWRSPALHQEGRIGCGTLLILGPPPTPTFLELGLPQQVHPCSQRGR